MARATGRRPALLSRVAEALYWAGRYVERAETTARAVLVHGDTHLDLPVGTDVGWRPLLLIAGVEQLFDDRHSLLIGGQAAPPASGPGESDVVPFLLTDTGNRSSVLAALAAARSNVRTARAVLPGDIWETSNELWRLAHEHRNEVAARDQRVRWLQRVLDGCAHLNACLWSVARADQAEAFVRVGQHLERADMTARVLGARATSLVPGPGERGTYAEVHHRAVLRSLAADEPFQRRGPGVGDDGEAIARFVLHDEGFARSVVTSLAEIHLRTKRWPRSDAVTAACADAIVLVSGAGRTGLSAGDLRATATIVQDAIRLVHDRIAAEYFPAARDEARPDDALPTATRTPAPAPPRSTTPALGPTPMDAVRSGPARASSPGGRTTTDEGAVLFRVVHRTVYRYDTPASASTNETHLRPRDTAHQRCLAHALAVDPVPQSSSDRIDTFGNHVQQFALTGAFDTLTVVATSDVLVSPAVPPPSTPPWETVRHVLAADRQPAGRAARQYLAGSVLVPIDDELAGYAAPSFTARRPLLRAVVDLASRIHGDLVYEPGFTSVTTPVLDVLQHRRGVCQDFAHLAIGCLRSMGLAARYVSGYIRSATPIAAGLVGSDASHAWFAVYVPGWGWVDVDPTNDQLVSVSHVTTAWGRDYSDVSPLRGTIEGGGPSQRLDVAVSMVPVPVGGP